MADEEANLTERQREVLALAREGKTPTEIGKELGISSQGVHGHLRRLQAHGLIEPSRRQRADRVRSADSMDAVRRAAKQEIATLNRRRESLDREIAKLSDERDEIDGTLKELRTIAGDK